MTPDQLLEQLRANLATLPGSPAVAAARESALAKFAETGYPSRKLEDWRYTDVAPIATGDFDLSPAPPQPQPSGPDVASLLASASVDSDAASLVFVDGELIDNRASDKFGDSLEILALSESLDRFGPAVSTATLQGYPLAALNVAFAGHGVHLRFAASSEPKQSIHLVLANLTTAPQRALQPQIVIELARQARADVVVHLVGGAQGSGWTNLLTKVDLDIGSELELRRIQTYGIGQLHTELLDAAIGADATFRLTTVDLGGRLVRNDISVRLEAPGANCDLGGIVLASDRQHIDDHIVVEHLASYTQSEQCFRSIVDAHGRGVFNGKVVAHKGTKGIAANQSSDNLLLAATGEVDTKPELEINTDDVKCSHGATIGELDASQLFYLQARGISASAARGLLTLGFANHILERVRQPELGERVAAKFGLDLPEEPRWRAVE
jgi:Fe-S cluster assembly protein SufD